MTTEFSNLGACRAALPDVAARADTAVMRYLANLKNAPLTPAQVNTAAKWARLSLVDLPPVLREPITSSTPAASALPPTTPESAFARRSHPYVDLDGYPPSSVSFRGASINAYAFRNWRRQRKLRSTCVRAAASQAFDQNFLIVLI
jgi:hypothetical protein